MVDSGQRSFVENHHSIRLLKLAGVENMMPPRRRRHRHLRIVDAGQLGHKNGDDGDVQAQQ